MERLTKRNGCAVYTDASEWEIRYKLADYEDIGTVEEFKKLKEFMSDDGK